MPYLDGIEIYHLPPFSPELAARSCSAARSTMAALLDPVTGARKSRARPGCPARDFYQSVIHAVLGEQQEKAALTTPAYAGRSISCSIGHVLVEVVKDVAPMMVGGFIYPFSEFATPRTDSPSGSAIRRDPKAAIQEARQLMAGGGLCQGFKDVDFLVRDSRHFKLWAVAIQAMLKEALNVEVHPPHRPGLGVVR